MKTKRKFVIVGYIQKAVYLKVEAKDEKEALKKAKLADALEWEEGNWESGVLDMQVVKTA